MTADHRPLVGRTSLACAGVLAAALTLSACGGSSASGSSGSTPAGSSSSTAATNGGSARRAGPAASGTIAAVSGTTMQVQNQQTGQVAVTWSGATTFSHTVAVRFSAIKVGSCVTAVGGSGAATSSTSFTATTLTVSAAQNGACTGRFGGGQRTGGGLPSGRPTGQRPSGFPSGANGPGRSFGAIASGRVTAVSGSTLTVAAQQFGSSATATRTVISGPATKIVTQAPTTAKALVVGKCATVQGKPDTTGTVAATRIEISDPSNGRCGFGSGGFGG